VASLFQNHIPTQPKPQAEPLSDINPYHTPHDSNPQPMPLKNLCSAYFA
jgi:hypothetical protein